MIAFKVRNGRNFCHLIPYIGNKSGFAHIFDSMVPDSAAKGRILDLFGGGAAFSIYCSYRFGSKRVTYNDSNPTVVNFLTWVRDDPVGLVRQYKRHQTKSSSQYYLETRDRPLDEGLAGAGRFLYLAKNAFSGKIRFNRSNKFNTPMRKNARCPDIDAESISRTSHAIRHIRITNQPYQDYADTENSFIYLDPPYMENANNHYNGVPDTSEFIAFVKQVEQRNLVMISEQNDPEFLKLSGRFTSYPVLLKRSLQYRTKTDSREIIAINYSLPNLPDTEVAAH